MTYFLDSFSGSGGLSLGFLLFYASCFEGIGEVYDGFVTELWKLR